MLYPEPLRNAEMGRLQFTDLRTRRKLVINFFFEESGNFRAIYFLKRKPSPELEPPPVIRLKHAEGKHRQVERTEPDAATHAVVPGI